jgi:hypothetical protein
MPDKSIHDAILKETPPEPVSGEVRVTLRQKGRLVQITVPEDKAWLYYLLDDQKKTIDSINSSLTLILLLTAVTAILVFIGAF